LQPGALEAFWIWREGGAWHLRTTTKANMHKFTGWVATEGLSSVTASKLEVADKVHVQNKMMHFEFTTAGHEDGLDFKTGADDCVRFQLRVDEKPEPNLIHIGLSAMHPAKAHFKLCPDGKMGLTTVAKPEVKPVGKPEGKEIKAMEKKDDKKDD